MTQYFKKKVVETPNGRVLVGPNGHLTPEVPCGLCHRPIRYYKGPYDEFPWFCSRACAAGEGFTKRCEACGGAMRKPTVFGRRTDGSEVTVCKSCALRMTHLFRKLEGMHPRFIAYAIDGVLHDILDGRITTKSLKIEHGTLIHTSKKVTPVEKPKEKVEKTPEKPKEFVDEVLQAMIRTGVCDENGVVLKGTHVGKVYREVFPLPPPPSKY